MTLSGSRCRPDRRPRRPTLSAVAKADRLERLTDLVLVLLNAPRPLSLDTIGREVPGYPTEHDARRQAFERDKRLLREEGIPVATEAIGGQEQFGYRIDPEAFYLPDLGLEPEEQTALSLAVAGVHLGDPSGRHALLKLGTTGVAEARPVASIVPPTGLAVLYDAIRTRAEVTFDYRGERRHGVPRGLRFHGGRWYLGAWDLDRRDWRTFRVDRIEGAPVVGAPQGASDPPDGRPSALGPWHQHEDDEAAVLVRVDPIEAPRVAAEVGKGAIVRWDEDGSVVLSLGVSTTGAFRSWVLGLLDHAEVLGPDVWRQRMVAWLEALAALPPSPSPPTRSEEARPAPGPVSAPAGRPATPARDARQRLRRLLAIVGWLARSGEVPISDIATRFGVEEGELVRELELAACCGLPPYSPDVLMEIVVTDDTVQAFLPEELSRPRRPAWPWRRRRAPSSLSPGPTRTAPWPGP
jgi:proteasome accessory factor B